VLDSLCWLTRLLQLKSDQRSPALFHFGTTGEASECIDGTVGLRFKLQVSHPICCQNWSKIGELSSTGKAIGLANISLSILWALSRIISKDMFGERPGIWDNDEDYKTTII
jgi:hypothetical protein